MGSALYKAQSIVTVCLIPYSDTWLYNTWTIQRISRWPNFVVLTYLHTMTTATTMTTMFVIWHCIGPIRHIIEVINVHKWWGPHMFQASYLMSTLEHARRPWGTNFTTTRTDRGFDSLAGSYGIVALLHSFYMPHRNSLWLPLQLPSQAQVQSPLLMAR